MAGLSHRGRKAVELGAVAVFFFGATFLAALGAGTDRTVTFEPLVSPDRTQSRPMELDWHANEVRQAFAGPPGNEYRGGDLASYLIAGERLLEGEVDWPFLAYWPIGMALWVALVLGIAGPTAYPLKMVVGAAILWGWALVEVYRAARPAGRWRLILPPFIAGLWLLPALRTYNFGFGSTMSEAPSHALFVIAFAWLVRGGLDENPRRMALGGGMLGLACLFRSFFHFAALFMLLAAPLAWVTLFVLQQWWRAHTLRAAVRQLHPRVSRSSVARLIGGLLLAFLACEAALLPFRIYRNIEFGSHRLTEFETGYIWKWAWKTDAEIPWYHHTGNTACRADPTLCQAVRSAPVPLSGEQIRNLALMTLVTHPACWLEEKAKNINWLWLGRSWSDVLNQPILLAEGLVQLLLGMGALAWLLWEAIRRRSLPSLYVAVLISAFVLLNVSLFTLIQFEWRYSQGLRILLYLLPVWAFAARKASCASNVNLEPTPLPWTPEVRR